MGNLLASLVPYALIIGIAFAVLGLLLLVLLFLMLRRNASSKAAPMPTADPKLIDSTPAAPVALQDLRQSFAAALSYLRNVTPGYRWRYAVPWYLVLGEKGAGKTTLLGEIESLRPPGAMEAVRPPAGRACTWHFFDGGVVLDVAGQLVLDPDRQQGDDRAWRQLVRLLLEHRPIRPLDGVVVTVPCGDFIGPDRLDVDALLAKADHMHRHLLDLQQRLGLQLPVYVVVSKCDWIPGFQSFWREVPTRRRDEIFGWSNSHDLDADVTPELLEHAFAGLAEMLYRLHLDIAGKDGEIGDAEGTLLFPSEFERLREPLKLYCTSLFRRSVYHDACFFRGFYFVGDGGPAPRRVGALTPGTRERLPPPADPRRRWPLFARELFAKKILRERNLAAIARSGQLPRARPVRIAVACLAAFVLIGSIGLWFAEHQLVRESASLLKPIGFIANGISGAAARASRPTNERRTTIVSVADAKELLGLFARLDVKHLRSFWLPSSWFSGIDAQIIDFFSIGFNSVILDAMRREFDLRTAAHIENAVAGRGKVPEGKVYALRGSPQVARLEQYVDALRAIEDHAVIYNRLDTPQASLADVEALTDFLLETELSHDFFVDSDLYSSALRHVVIRRFDPAAYADRTAMGLEALLRPFEQFMAPNGPIVERFTQVSASLDDLDRAVASRGDAGSQLRRLSDALATVQGMLDDPDFAWVVRERIESDPGFAQLLKNLGSSGFFSPKVRQALEDEANRGLNRLRDDLRQVTLRRTVPLLDQADGHIALRLSPPPKALAAALPKLLARSFMATPEQRAIALPARGVWSAWDPDRLTQAVMLYQGYEQFLDAELQTVALDFGRAVDGGARQRLNANMTAAIAKAQVNDAVAPGSTQSAETILFAGARSFGRAARPLGDLLTILSQLGFNQTYDELREAAGRQAYGLLESVDQQLERQQLYGLRLDTRPWQPTVPATLIAFGLRDDVEVAQYLDTQRNWVARLATDGAQPLLDFLTRSDFAVDWRPIPLAGKWQRIVLELQKYQNANPRNSVAALENFIRFDLAAVTRDTCAELLSSDRFGATGDYFLERRSALRQGLLGQCTETVSTAGATGYRQLADLFNRMLAGRFPFATSYSGNDAESAPLDPVVDYLRVFAANAPAARKGLAKGATSGQQDALAFLDQMEKVRAFLTPFLDDSGPDLPGYEVDVDFRVNRRFEQGADQIIDWDVTVGDQNFHRGTPSKPQRWHLGDPVTVSLRWAKDGPVAPVVEGSADEEELTRRVVSYLYADRWALLRLLTEHRAPPGDIDRRSEAAPHVLEFTARTVVVAGVATTAPAPLGQAKAFIRFRLTTAPASGKTPVALMQPDFPARAPLLLGEASQ